MTNVGSRICPPPPLGISINGQLGSCWLDKKPQIGTQPDADGSGFLCKWGSFTTSFVQHVLVALKSLSFWKWIHLLIQSFTHQFVYLLIPSFTDSFFHSFIHSFIPLLNFSYKFIFHHVNSMSKWMNKWMDN